MTPVGDVVPFPGKKRFNAFEIVAAARRKFRRRGVLDAAIVEATHPANTSGVTTLHYLGGHGDIDVLIDELMAVYEWPDAGAQQHHSPDRPRQFPFG